MSNIGGVYFFKKRGIVLYLDENYGLAVIGAGHAGIESALIAAKLGVKTVIFTMSMDFIGNCPCNPSIGGTAKGHLVREIDALGGEMAKTADKCCIQARVLNKGKGPAVHSLRMQIDRHKYAQKMKQKIEQQNYLDVKQAEIVCVLKDKNFYILKTKHGLSFKVKSVILATGTYLEGKVFIGQTCYNSGPDGTFPSMFLKKSLEEIGVKFRRFKTGTPARALKSSLDFSKMQIQLGDKDAELFSFCNLKNNVKNLSVCYITWTNEKTKDVILKNVLKSIFYTRENKAIGPRYCPSIEDKVIRFPKRKRHQIFVEPCGIKTDEMYLQGLSSSLPEDIQIEFLRTISGFENISLTRPAYAIEYDCINPICLDSTLEFSNCTGLFFAGQITGSSGYEEAAAQGIVAGINAALRVLGKPLLILKRESSYIGTLINDMTTKGVSEPYRMMTSRAEHRLILRQDNADERLIPIAKKLGLISDKRWENFLENLELKNKQMKKLKNTILSPNKEVNKKLESIGSAKINTGIKLSELLKRPEINYRTLIDLDFLNSNLPEFLCRKIEIQIKYEGYIKKQLANIKKTKKNSFRKLPKTLNYKNITGLKLEAQEKLLNSKPENIGEAAKISGVGPADIAILHVWLAKHQKQSKIL